MLDAAVAATPERLPALLERYAQDIAFGTVRPEAVAEFHRLSAASADQGDDYAQLLYGLGQPERTPASLTVGELQAAASKLLAQPVTWFAVGTAPDDNIRDGFAKTIGAVSRHAVLKTAPALQREGLHAASVEDGDGDRARVQLSFFTPMNWTPETSFLISALNPVAQQALKNELRYKLGGIYTLQFELELDAGSNRAIGTLSFYCAPERAQELTDAAIGVLDRMPEIVRGVDIDRIRADIDFAEGSRLDDPNTLLRRLALSYRRYDNAGYLTRMKDLPGRLTQQVFEAEAASVFKTDNLAVLTRLPVERAEP